MQKKSKIEIEKILKSKHLLTDDSIVKDILENSAVRGIGKIILASVFIAGTITLSAVAPNMFGAAGKLRQMIRGGKKWAVSKKERLALMQTINNLRNRKLIECGKEGDKIILKITPAGRSRFLRNRIYDIKVKKQKRWDGVWRIAMFDIPNKKGASRDLFRSRLKNMGFFQFQKSAFLTPFPCKNELEAVLEYYEIFDYVTYIEASYVSGEGACRKYFGV